MIYRARALVTMDGAPVENGAVLVEGNRIRAAGTFSEIRNLSNEPVIDLGEQVLLPGLINAHCHLDYTMMRSAINPQQSFSQWIARINAIKRSLHEEDYLRAVANGFEELKKSGVTTVFNVESVPELMLTMPPPPIRAWWFYELIDIRNCIATEELVGGALKFFEKDASWMGGRGLSPHSPYTASPELYRLANACGEDLCMPLTTHMAESHEENEMFRHGRGLLYDFMASIGRDMTDCGHGSSTRNMLVNKLIGQGWIIAHANGLDDDDIDLLAAPGLAGTIHFVHCPRSHKYFNHPPFAFQKFHERGLPVSLGTDSLASNDSLNLFAEMQAVEKNETWLSPWELLKTVTLNPARAIKQEGLLGVLKPGAFADMIALPFNGGISTVLDQIIHFWGWVEWMLVDGREEA